MHKTIFYLIGTRYSRLKPLNLHQGVNVTSKLHNENYDFKKKEIMIMDYKSKRNR